jgi:hypothetical protein
MARSQLIVCEKSNYWAIALRWAFADAGVRLLETRTWIDCWHVLETSSSGFLAVELRESNLDEVFRGLGDLHRFLPEVAAVVMMDRELSHHEWALREIGVLHVAVSRRDLKPAAQLATRYLLREAAKPPRSLRASFWDRIPWRESAGV